MKSPEFGELDHGVEAVAGVLRGEAHHHPVEDDVFARRQLRVEADPELDEGGQAAGHADRAGVGPVDAGEQLQQRALAGAVAADDAEELALAGSRRRRRRGPAARGSSREAKGRTIRSFSESTRLVGMRNDLCRSSTWIARRSVGAERERPLGVGRACGGFVGGHQRRRGAGAGGSPGGGRCGTLPRGGVVEGLQLVAGHVDDEAGRGQRRPRRRGSDRRRSARRGRLPLRPRARRATRARRGRRGRRRRTR